AEILGIDKGTIGSVHKTLEQPSLQLDKNVAVLLHIKILNTNK
ncbi:28242_t:CDS:1, partial [Gigaspora margarita]